MSKLIDLTGKRFGKLTVISKAGHNVYGKLLWDTICECGNKKITSGEVLKRGHVKSCGCIYRLQKGLSQTKEYKVWHNMMRRCYNPRCSSYKSYGKLGITVCERWHNFKDFLADMGMMPTQKHSIDRVNSSKGYSPDNCRWILLSENKKHHKKTYTKHK